MMGIVKEKSSDAGVIDRFLCSSMRFAVMYLQSYTEGNFFVVDCKAQRERQQENRIE